MRSSLLFVTLIIANSTIFGQDSFNVPTGQLDYKNSIQSELFGHGLYYSINYERILFNDQLFKTTGQIGFSYYPESTGLIELWIPVLLNELISFDKHHIEMGAGYIFTNETDTNTLPDSERVWGGFFTGRIGYRYQKPTGRFIVRLAFTPIIEYKDIKEFHPSGGLSFGYAF